MQQLMCVYFTQPIQQMHEHMAHQSLRHLILPHLNLLLQGAPPLVAHHHINGFVGPEEIEHAHDIGMIDLGKRAAFLEEAFHAVAK